jgi:23S rRNA (pseudouridine1915-N3)-methyltransferase
MRVLVCLHGKPKDKRILELLEEYKLKISRYQKIDFDFLAPPTRSGEIITGLIEKYKGKKIYLLDEDGKEYTSMKFAENYERDLNNGEKEVVFVIGPAEGFGDLKVAEKAKLFPPNLQTISLSKFAMQHDIASLVLVEQIYRAISIKNNLPYHKI